jgi:ribonuclease HII
VAGIDGGQTIEAGVDECARGSLIYDVVAACVVMPLKYDDDKYLQIKDSKKLSAKKRNELAIYIKNIAITYGIGTASCDEIDDINILQATYKAMHRAINEAYKKHPFNNLKIDGPNFKSYIPPGIDSEPMNHECIIKGDSKYLSIAAASIIAKDYHDAKIKELVEQYPELEKYGLLDNQGYGTIKHRNAIKEFGVTRWHRKTFGSVKEFI